MASPAPPAPAGSRGQVVVTVSSPARLLSLVPCLLGFHPGELDVVFVGSAPPRGRVRLTIRLDVPRDPRPGQAAGLARHAAGVLSANGCTQACMAGYGPDNLIGPVAAAFRQAAPAVGLTIADLLRAEDGRYWSYLCDSPACCSPEGVPYQPLPEITVPFAEAGTVVLPSRAAVAATIAPVTGAQASAMLRATDRARARAQRLARHAGRPGRKAARSPVEIAGARAVAAAMRAYRDGATLSHDQAAWLAVTLTGPGVFHAAWARMDPARHQAHQRLWTDLTRLARPGHAAAPACLLALAAWQSGQGALGHLALDRATDDGGHPLVPLLRAALDAGAPPALADPKALCPPQARCPPKAQCRDLRDATPAVPQPQP